MKWIFLAGAICSEVTASLAMKAALDNPAFIAVVVVGYIASFGFLAGTLRQGMPLGVAYGIWAAIGVTLTVLLATLLFGEPLKPLMMVGIVLVIGGVLCVELGSHRPVPASGCSLACPLQGVSRIRHLRNHGDGQRPVVHGIQDRPQFLTSRGQFVNHPGRDFRVDGPGQQAMVFELPQRVRQRMCTDAGQSVLDLAEPERSSQQLANDQCGPRSIHETQKTGDATAGKVRSAESHTRIYH